MNRSQESETGLNVRLLRDDEVQSWMSSDRHAAEWRTLYEDCGFDNPYLSEEYVRVWSECYDGQYRLVLIVGEDRSGSLRALMPLAETGQKLTGAGHYHAEYQGWLCNGASDSEFLEASLLNIAECFPDHVLSLRYVLSKKHQKAIDQVADRLSTTRNLVTRRPLIELDQERLDAALRKKGNRSKHNRLKRQGELRMARLSDTQAFDRYMPAVVAAYDFRQGGVNDSLPFREDDRKWLFHRRWFETCPDQLEVSLLLLDDAPIAAFFGVRVGQSVANAIVSHEPAFAPFSASKLHIYLFAAELASTETGYLDLTPGGDLWKERFATGHEVVYDFVFFASERRARAEKLQRRLLKMAAKALAIVGVTPQQARGAVAKIRRISWGSFRNRISAITPSRIEYRIYRLRIADRPNHSLDQTAKVDSLSDLIAFSADDAWMSRAAFLREASSRLSRGEKAYTVRTDDRLVHYGWLNPCQDASHFSEVDFVYQYPAAGAVLYDFFSAPESRGQGLYQRTIAQMLDDLGAQEEHPEWAYISVLADNGPSRHVIEKMGFCYVESVIRETRPFHATCRIENIVE